MKRTKTAAYLHQGSPHGLTASGPQDGNAGILVQHHEQTKHLEKSQNLEDGSDRETKKESDRVHVSTCLQRDSETREYTKAHNGLSHNLALPRTR